MKTFQYTLIQIFQCILICALNGYAAVYLLDHQFTNTMIGTILSVSNILGVLLQQVIASWVDNSHGKIKARQIVMASFMLMAILSVVLSFLKQPTILFLILFVSLITLIGIMTPFISALIFDFKKQGVQINFGLARGMGSASYAVSSLILGQVTASYGTKWLPLLYAGIATVSFVSVMLFKTPSSLVEEKESKQESHAQQNFFKKYPLLTYTLIAVVFIFFGFNLTNSYLFQIVQHVGGDQSHLGVAMFLAAIVELPAMTLVGVFAKKVGHQQIMKIAALFFSIKHTLLWLAPNLTLIYLAQLLQFCSYAFFIPTSVFLVSENVESNDSMKGQALMTGAVSVGGVGASAIGGVLLDMVGVSSTLFVATVISWVGSILLISTMNKMKRG